MSYEGGFQGRTNKLVDGCYSFWQGGAFPVIHMAMFKEGKEMEIYIPKLNRKFLFIYNLWLSVIFIVRNLAKIFVF